MSRESDLHYQLDRAGNAVTDAICCVHSAGILPLPTPHRKRLGAALRKLEGAQLDLFNLRNDPWSEPSVARSSQLALL